MRAREPEQVVARNRRARHDYEIGDTYEAGIVLVGDEVKSLREGRASLVDGFVDLEGGEAWLLQVHIPAYSQSARVPRRRSGPGGESRPDPRTGWTRRKRKLLLHRREIDAIARQVGERGLTVVPLSLYFSGGRAKVEIALARGRRSYDKRQALAAREASREAEQELGRRLKGRDQ